MIELDADGAWLYWATPTGPVRRIATALLTDESLTDADLASAIQTIAEIPTIGGTAMDTLGNLYLSDAENRRIAVLTPQGRMLTLVQDDRLASPDAICIDGQRRLLVPASQLENLASGTGGDDRTRAPWQVLALQLPRELAGIRLGDAVTGRSPPRGLSNIHGIEHVAMTVPDMEAAIRFLEEAFGATVLYRHLKLTDAPLTAADVGRINGLPETATMRGACQMRLGDGANIELFQLTGIARTEAAGINDIGLNHFSMFVDDIALATERFAAAGGTLLEGPNDLGLSETGAGNQLWFGPDAVGHLGRVHDLPLAAPLRCRRDPGAPISGPRLIRVQVPAAAGTDRREIAPREAVRSRATFRSPGTRRRLRSASSASRVERTSRISASCSTSNRASVVERLIPRRSPGPGPAWSVKAMQQRPWTSSECSTA
ncbi:catechol 2,3-dioxygenase-like lactoylglutathione lyase family enzyme [Methylorubrum extorquens]|nr:catechol 2,3-dioxygenase-like lactoylglutathione lyase family enzyme [Methylorubrum extorquens]